MLQTQTICAKIQSMVAAVVEQAEEVMKVHSKETKCM